MLRSLTPMSLCVLFLMCWSFSSPPGLALARQRTKSRLSLWIDEAQVKTLTGYEWEIKIIANGEVTPYVHSPDLFTRIVIPPEIDTVNLTWQAGPDILIFVPGHMGVVGNERADRLAGSATISDDQSMDRADILNALIECGCKEDFHLNQSTSTTRLQDLGLKIGAAQKEQHSSTPTYLTTLSHWTNTCCINLCWESQLEDISQDFLQITIPCKGKESGVASLTLGLKIFDHLRRPLEGTPIDFRLKKQCVAFVTSSLCPQECKNGGTCNPHGVCECPQGFRGTLCDKALCNPACQNNGTCISPATCACPTGFHGIFCEKGTSLSTSTPASLCGRACQNGGHCLPEGFCWCAQGFYGDACEYSHCVPMCLNGGTCTGTDQCLCSAEFSGHLCEIKEDTDRPRRSKEPDSHKLKKDKKKQPNKSLEGRLRKAEQRLLKITFRRVHTWAIPEDELRTLRKLKNKAEKESLNLQERRYLIKFLTQERRHLNSKDKTKLKQFKNLIRQAKKRQKPRKRRLYVK